MMDRTISWSRYPGLCRAAIDGGGAVRRGFDDGRNNSCRVEILHLEGLVVETWMMAGKRVSGSEVCCRLEKDDRVVNSDVQ